MITFREIARYIGAEPFRPFRIQMAGGRTFEIRHPEMVKLGKTTLTIFTFFSDDPKETEERQIEVSLLLTESIEPLDANVRAQGA